MGSSEKIKLYEQRTVFIQQGMVAIKTMRYIQMPQGTYGSIQRYNPRGVFAATERQCHPERA